MDSQKLINELGGPAAVARLFEIKQPSVSEWKRKGIPKARLQTLRLLRPDLFQSLEGEQDRAA
ncbi:Rha family transcriptional regulator [Stenotrophomonas maltophilia]|uniref:helix-turn-helix domain-containing protein n=1 Tax=Stenotrophomonas maltophilia TaxID=40324 RepID=UPI0021C642D7|nr:helix-turn-helix domain-containing protein [Stenotrophomonas maltophilia]MCU1053281.1 Rha family transcriptional regulator [Stenotrophomonas maltophilia]